jgi:hypothetical protein
MNARRKGHNFERLITRDLKQIFDKARTSREASKLLDDSGVDIAFVPFAIQCKSGYNSRRPKADELFVDIRNKLKTNFPEGEPICRFPPVLIHKLGGHGNHKTLVTMQYCDWLDLIKKLYGTVS